MSFYNTTHDRLHNLTQNEAKASAQEDIVKNIFRGKRKGLTAPEVLRLYPDNMVPLTSIRRAITNLTNTGYLVKTPFKREGLFGRNNFIYRLNTGQMTLFN